MNIDLILQKLRKMRDDRDDEAKHIEKKIDSHENLWTRQKDFNEARAYAIREVIDLIEESKGEIRSVPNPDQ